MDKIKFTFNTVLNLERRDFKTPRRLFLTSNEA